MKSLEKYIKEIEYNLLLEWKDDERHRIDAETEWAKEERDDRNTDSIYRKEYQQTERRKKEERFYNFK